MEISRISALDKFKDALKTPASKERYPKKLRLFFDFHQIPGLSLEEQAERFVEMAKENGGGLWVQDCTISYLHFQMQRVNEKKDLKAGTLKTYYFAVKLFCEMKEDELGTGAVKWKRLSRGLPASRSYAEDRAPEVKEIRSLIEHTDRRVKPMVLVMCSSGIRVGSWEDLSWKHVKPVRNEKGEIVAAILTVYDDEHGNEKYDTLMTAEAFHSLDDWMQFRKLHGEKITDDSPLMRDIWETANVTYGKRGLATNPIRLKRMGILRILNRAIWTQGLRRQLENGRRRHPWKTSHGFRKFFHTQATGRMLDKNINRLSNHHIGYEPHYYRPIEQSIVEDYLRAATHLTINEFDKATLQKLIEKAEAAERTIEQIERMQKQIEFLMEHAYVSEHGVEWYETLTNHIPAEEFVEYMDKANLQDSDPEYGKFIFEDAAQGVREHKKYQEDIIAYGKRRLEEDFQRWWKQEREKRALKPKDDDEVDNNENSR